jgi:hypothetical protein
VINTFAPATDTPIGDFSICGPDTDGLFGAWDHHNAGFLPDADGATRLDYRDAVDLAREWQDSDPSARPTHLAS